MFIGCSHFPQCHHIESVKQPFPSDSKHPIKCPECGRGQLVERKSRFGKVFWACDCYPKCRFAVNLPPIPGCCTVCGFTLLVEKKSASGRKRICANRKCGSVQADDNHDALPRTSGAE
jgi:putative DNA topoisomerase